MWLVCWENPSNSCCPWQRITLQQPDRSEVSIIYQKNFCLRNRGETLSRLDFYCLVFEVHNVVLFPSPSPLNNKSDLAISQYIKMTFPFPFLLLFLFCFVFLWEACTGETALGLESGLVTFQQMTASSTFKKNHGPSNGRLNHAAANGKTGAWSAGANDANQWLQVDFGRNVRITKLATQGRQDYDQWVKTFTLSYSVDGNPSFQIYQENGAEKVWWSTVLLDEHFSQTWFLKFLSIKSLLKEIQSSWEFTAKI